MKLNNNTVRKYVVCILFLSCFLTLNMEVYAQSDALNITTTAVPFLRISPDAQAGGMGDVGIATDANANSIFYNRAKLPFAGKQNQIGVSYAPWMHNITNDMYLLSASGYHQFDEMQVISASIRYFNIGDVPVIDYSGNKLYSTQPKEYAIDLGYSRKLSKKLGLAVALRYINSSLVNGSVNGVNYQTGKTVAGDVSLYYNDVDSSNGGFSAGLAISNLGGKIGYTSNSNQKDFIPANLGVGIAYTGIWDEGANRLTIGMDVNHLLVPKTPNNAQGLNDYYNQSVINSWGSSFDNRQYSVGVGAEFVYMRQFSLRAGYVGSLVSGSNINQGVTVGCSVRFKDNYDVNFSYFSSGGNGAVNSPLNNTLRLGFNIAF